MNHRCRARIAGLSVLCVAGMGGSFIANPASAAPDGSGAPSAPATSCNGDKNVEIFNVNDSVSYTHLTLPTTPYV